MIGRLNEKIAGMSPVQRAVAIMVSLTLAMFVLGFWVGFGASAIEHGRLPRKPLGYVVIVVAAAATIGIVQLLRVLLRGGIFDGMTAFNQRYWKMILAIGVIGALIGIGLISVGLIGTSMSLSKFFAGDFTTGPVAAVVMTIALAILISLAFWLYHRAIDDHEERAYLWGSQLAYYFVMLAVPGWWLLSRGGLLRPLDFTATISIILASLLVQAGVWAWFKFR